jgi:hypothetical protein
LLTWPHVRASSCDTGTSVGAGVITVRQACAIAAIFDVVSWPTVLSQGVLKCTNSAGHSELLQPPRTNNVDTARAITPFTSRLPWPAIVCFFHILQSLSANALIHRRSLTRTHLHGPQLAKFGSVTLGARVSNTIASKIIDVEIYQDEPGMCVRLLHSCITRLFFFARACLRLRARRSWPRRLAERTPSGEQLEWLCLMLGSVCLVYQ